MKYTYIGSEVTGLNRGAIEGEQEGICSPQDLIKGMDISWYKVISGVLTVKEDEEKEAEDEVKARKVSLETKILEIDQRNREENQKDFEYQGSMYHADDESIQAVAIEASMMNPTDPIPTPGGVWKTAEREEDGLTPIYEPYNCEDFMSFKSAYYKRSADNFGVKETHKNNVKGLYLSGATSQEIDEYDISVGWV